MTPLKDIELMHILYLLKKNSQGPPLNLMRRKIKLLRLRFCARYGVSQYRERSATFLCGLSYFHSPLNGPYHVHGAVILSDIKTR